MLPQNDRGPIADSYHMLQGLAHLVRAREQTPLPAASDASRLRCLLQSAEVALLNIADLLGRAAVDVAVGDPGRALGKLRWAVGFHRILSRLGRTARMVPCRPAVGAVARLGESPGYAAVTVALRELDARLITRYGNPPDAVGTAVTADGPADPLRELVHLSLVCNREAAAWERLLVDLPSPMQIPSYALFVGTDCIGAAVRDLPLRGDTYMTQFRGLHQIPEVLAAEAGDLLAAGVRQARGGRTADAARSVRTATVLFEGSLPCLDVLVNNLTAADYFRIRENLGQTSGSQSVGLHYHLFHDLYAQLAEAVLGVLAGATAAADPATAARAVVAAGPEDEGCGGAFALAEACLGWRAIVAAWRESHLSLPRTALGGADTRSLIGSADAVSAVVKMRDRADRNDPLAPVADAFGLPAGLAAPALIATYLDSDESWDRQVQRSLGVATQARFAQVQTRTGVFAGRCPFTPPPPRRVD